MVKVTAMLSFDSSTSYSRLRGCLSLLTAEERRGAARPFPFPSALHSAHAREWRNFSYCSSDTRSPWRSFIVVNEPRGGRALGTRFRPALTLSPHTCGVQGGHRRLRAGRRRRSRGQAVLPAADGGGRRGRAAVLPAPAGAAQGGRGGAGAAGLGLGPGSPAVPGLAAGPGAGVSRAVPAQRARPALAMPPCLGPCGVAVPAAAGPCSQPGTAWGAGLGLGAPLGTSELSGAWRPWWGGISAAVSEAWACKTEGFNLCSAVVSAQRLDSMISAACSNLTDSVIL